MRRSNLLPQPLGVLSQRNPHLDEREILSHPFGITVFSEYACDAKESSFIIFQSLVLAAFTIACTLLDPVLIPGSIPHGQDRKCQGFLLHRCWTQPAQVSRW
jgi:hypothetical protein